MTHRTFDEQIANFNRVVSSWDINQEYKVALLGMIASLGYEHEKSITPEPHWIPVTERLPEVGKSVLICDAYGDICLGHRANYGYYFPDFCGDRVKNVTAWCNLPEPYKGVTE